MVSLKLLIDRRGDRMSKKHLNRAKIFVSSKTGEQVFVGRTYDGSEFVVRGWAGTVATDLGQVLDKNEFKLLRDLER